MRNVTIWQAQGEQLFLTTFEIVNQTAKTEIYSPVAKRTDLRQ